MFILLTSGSKPWTSVMLTLIFVDLRKFSFILFEPSVFFSFLFYNLGYEASGLFNSFNSWAALCLTFELRGS